MKAYARTTKSKAAGLPPGSLIHVGAQKSDVVRIRQIDYNEARFEEKQPESIGECPLLADSRTVT